MTKKRPTSFSVKPASVAVCFLLSALSPASAQLILNGEHTYTDEGTAGDPVEWTDGFRLGIGEGESGTLNLVNSVIRSGAFGRLAEGANSTAEMNIGSGSIFNFANSTVDTVGLDGTAVVNVASGGRLDTRQVILGRNEGSSGTVNLDGGWWQHLTWYVDVGRAGTGAVNVLNGASITAAQRFIVGGTISDTEAAGGTGFLTVDGAGSSVDFANSGIGFFGVGRRGTGFATVSNGGVMNVTGNPAAATYNRQNIWIGTQEGGQGTLTIESGGVVNTDGILRVSSGGAGDSFVSVDGAGSQLTTELEAYIGNTGEIGSTGRLDISDGGAVNIGAQMQIGNFVGRNGIVTVDGAGSVLDIGEWLHVATSGTGTLSVTNGGRVDQATSSTVGNMFIGRNDGADGTVLVSGAGSELNAANSLFIAANANNTANTAQGLLTVADGGLVTVGNDLRVRGEGTVVLEGGSLVVSGDAAFLDAASLTGHGTLASDLAVGPNTTLQGTGEGITLNGMLSGSGTVENFTLGGLDVLASAGSFTLNDVGFGNDAVLNIVIDDLGAQNLIAFNGGTDFGGVFLNISFSDISPDGSEVFSLFNYAGSGSADYNFAGVTTPDGWSFNDGIMAIPEPSTYALLFGLVALAGASVLRRRQRK